MTHPITPPPDLVEQWEGETAHTTKDEMWHVAVQAARWGANQELEACCEWLQHDYPNIGANALRTARRPKPPSLKEQALNDLDDIPTHDDEGRQVVDLSNIRRAIEQLPD